MYGQYIIIIIIVIVIIIIVIVIIIIDNYSSHYLFRSILQKEGTCTYF